MHTLSKVTGLVLLAASLNAYSCEPVDDTPVDQPPGGSAPQAPDCDCDASIDKVVSEPLSAGGTGQYTLYVDYYGDEHCRDGLLCVQDVLPAGLSYSGFSASSAWNCSESGGIVDCCFSGSLPTSPVSLVPIVINVNVDPALSGEEIENCATILQGDDYFADSYEGNNESCVVDEVGCGDLREPLDTGYDDIAAAPATPGAAEDDWTLIFDGAGGVVPRQPDVVNPFGGWLTPLGSSNWLSPTSSAPGSGTAGWTFGSASYTYERCWCMDEAFSDPELSLQMRADDMVTAVRLNGVALTPTAGTLGAFNDPQALEYFEDDPALFEAGRNCVQVDVLDTQSVVTGLDVAGSIEAIDGQCCELQGQSDLAIRKYTAAASFTMGDQATYTINVMNQGSLPESTITVVDPLDPALTFVSCTNPSEWSCSAAPATPPQVVTCSYIGPPLAPGDSTSFDLIVQLADPATWPGGELIENCADVSGAFADVDPSDNLSCVETPVGCGDLDEDVSTGLDNTTGMTPSPGNPDDDWNIVVDPSGGVVPRSATIVATYPGWLPPFTGSGWIAGDDDGTASARPLSVPGGIYTYERCWCQDGLAGNPNLYLEMRADNTIEQVRLNGAPLTPISGTAGAFNDPDALIFDESDPTLFKPGQNCVQVDVNNWGNVSGLNVSGIVTAADGECCSIEPNGEVDLAISKTHQGNFHYGGQGTFTIEVTNNGPGTAVAFDVSDPMPAGYWFVSTSNPSEWSCAVSGGGPQTVDCSYIGPPLAPGDSSSFDLIVDVAPIDEWPHSDVATNCATVTGADPDPDSSNNESCDQVVHVN